MRATSVMVNKQRISIRGYKLQKENIYGELLDADRVTNAEFGVTSIYVNNEVITDYVSINIPQSIFGDNYGKARIYVSSILLILPTTNICIINVYRPSVTTIQGTKLHINQLQNVIN